MALDSLDWFIQLAQKGNFTRAAEELGISQQTLSARLATLEKELDAKLMTRATPLTLTPAGEAFMTYATEQEQARTRMIRRVDEASEGGSGVLKIAIGNMRGRALMPMIISEFHKILPNVRFQLFEGTNDELIEMGERGEVDLVVARMDEAHPGLSCTPLYREEVVLAICPELLSSVMGMPVEEAVETLELNGLEALRECPFLLEDDTDLAGRIAKTIMKQAGIVTEGVVHCESMTILLALCRQGLGAVFCPATMLDSTSDVNSGLVRIHLGDVASYQISMGRPINAEPWTPAQLFEDTLGAIFGA